MLTSFAGAYSHSHQSTKNQPAKKATYRRHRIIPIAMLSLNMIHHTIIHPRSGVPTILTNLRSVYSVSTDLMPFHIILRPEWVTGASGVGTMVILVVDSHMFFQVAGTLQFSRTSIIRANNTSLGGLVSCFRLCLIFGYLSWVPVESGGICLLVSQLSWWRRWKRECYVRVEKYICVPS